MTYSIVALDQESGDIGVAVQSHWFGVANLVPFAQAGIGAVATQAHTNTEYGDKGLRLLREGIEPEQILERLLSDDPGREFRQAAIISRDGRVATHTGKECTQYAGHRIGAGYSVQANMMLTDTVCEAMERAFLATKAPFPDQLMAALTAAEAEGGDLRGQRSASIVIVRGVGTGSTEKDRVINLHVYDHPSALLELARLLKTQHAYALAYKIDCAFNQGDVATARKHFSECLALLPENIELSFWYGAGLIRSGERKEGIDLLNSCISKGESWGELAKRMIAAGQLKIKQEELSK